MSKLDNGFKKAVVANLIVGAAAALLVKWLATMFLNPLAGILLAYIALAMSILYVGSLGFRKVPIGHLGIGLWFEKRVPDQIYPEGWCWNWPKPFGGIKFEDVREETLDVQMTEVLTEDNVPVTIDLSIQFKVTDLSRSLDVNNPKGALKEAVDSITRIIVQDIESEQIAQEKKNIPNQIQNGSAELERLEIKSLGSYSESQWGIRIINIRITSIRLPEELEKARTNVQIMKAEKEKETQQAEAEVIEAKNVAKLIEIYTGAGLDPALAANVAQSERGKATRIIIDGSASRLERAGALAGGISNQGQSSQPNPANTPPRSPRRRNKGKE